ncbi:hypothetical protein EYC84_004610 [Monilinia fructicola]|uniref:Uncharacterized protein n=1 Tax=Monilinia fructicola TaxID=38448 RepID=A0A5M9K3W9_MONFR|nr:hypothetical protein EYC84_004610 [Monilinia fructicola]
MLCRRDTFTKSTLKIKRYFNSVKMTQRGDSSVNIAHLVRRMVMGVGPETGDSPSGSVVGRINTKIRDELHERGIHSKNLLAGDLTLDLVLLKEICLIIFGP